MDLTALADFNAAALHGGFGPAVWKLDPAKATLSRRVAELEQSLGVRLIERAHERCVTEEGRALHERTRGLLAEIDEAGEAIAWRAPVPRDRLRGSASVVSAHVVLTVQGYVSRSRIRSSNWRSLPRTGPRAGRLRPGHSC
jgi:DNA-binding transcriptional LysR family regulator